LILDGGFLYAHRMRAIEEALATALRERFAAPSTFAPAKVEAAVADLRACLNPAPSDEQAVAITNLLSRSLGLLTGGPGTGKTTTALGVARCLVRLGVPPNRIALTAPTGKAAARLEESFRAGLATATAPADVALRAGMLPPQTLHRLLGYAHGRFQADLDHPLPYDAVLVDEGSMIDLGLMEPLLLSTPLSTPLVVMGDADQLPSVAEGALFRDLAPHAIRLGRLFRVDTATPQGQALATAAAFINTGDPDGLHATCRLHASPDELDYAGVERLEAPQRIALLRAHFDRHQGHPDLTPLRQHRYTFPPEGPSPDDTAKLDRLFSAMARARVLAVTLRRPTGVDQTNAFFHDLMGGGPNPLPGEPVLIRRNDYQRNLWNGDQGIVVWTNSPTHARQASVVFRQRDGYQAFPLSALENALVLGHALSVHKAQGSEIAEVVLLLPDSPCPLLSRELLYTALTRAKKSVVICGSDERLTQAILSPGHRESGIAERIAEISNQNNSP
jgi:exodeoxyribonuclease V alpha subunit